TLYPRLPTRRSADLICNRIFTDLIPLYYGDIFDFSALGQPDIPVVDIPKVTAIWAVEGSLLIGILTVFVFAFKQVNRNFTKDIRSEEHTSELQSRDN